MPANCRLILDSSCDLPRRILDDAGVEFGELRFVMNDGEHPDDLFTTMDSHAFFDRMRGGEVVGTSQVPNARFMELFEAAAEEGTPTVYLALAAPLSGTFEGGAAIAEQVRAKYPDFELHVVDSKLASIAYGLLAYEAIKQRDAGMTASQLAAWAQEACYHVGAIFMVDDLEPLRRGGRIPTVAANIGAKLDVKALLNFNLDGSLGLAGVARGHKKGLKAIVAEYEKQRAALDEAAELAGKDVVIIGNADDPSAAEWVEKHLARPDGALPPLHSTIGPVIGAHVGPGMVACVFWGPDRRAKTSLTDKLASKFK